MISQKDEGVWRHTKWISRGLEAAGKVSLRVGFYTNSRLHRSFREATFILQIRLISKSSSPSFCGNGHIVGMRGSETDLPSAPLGKEALCIICM